MAPPVPASPAPASPAPFAVCLLCSGNICRSPMAAVVLADLAGRRGLDGGTLADRLRITSAGIGGWHAGEPMDPRARRALEARGYRDPGHVARQLDRRRLSELDLVVALDRSHLVREIESVLLRRFDPLASGALEVPDPYYGDDDGFAECLAVIERSCGGLVEWLAARLA